VADFIPQSDDDCLAWMNQFSGVILADAPRYMQQPSDANTIASAVQEFAAALLVTKDKNTRTPATTAIKEIKRAAAEGVCRQYAGLIKRNGGISDADKIAAGVPPMNNSRESIEAPTTYPIVSVYGALTNSHTLRYHDQTTPDSSRKPAGVTQIQIFMVVGTADEPSPESAKYYGTFTRSPIGVALDPADRSKVATYFGRWVTAKGLVGPWSPPTSMTIAA
jgi:hypothetical protein